MAARLGQMERATRAGRRGVVVAQSLSSGMAVSDFTACCYCCCWRADGRGRGGGGDSWVRLWRDGSSKNKSGGLNTTVQATRTGCEGWRVRSRGGMRMGKGVAGFDSLPYLGHTRALGKNTAPAKLGPSGTRGRRQKGRGTEAA